MRFPSFLVLICAVCRLGAQSPDGSAGGHDPGKELFEIETRVRMNIGANNIAKGQARQDLARLDALLPEFPDARSPEVARVLVVQAMILVNFLGEGGEAELVLKRIEKDFPNSPPAALANDLMVMASRLVRAKEIQTEIIGKPAPGLKFIWSSKSGLQGIESLKGRVVVLAFWVTWHKSCVIELDALRDLADHFEHSDVAIVSVTSLQGFIVNEKLQRIDFDKDPKGEMHGMARYLKEHKITWPVVISQEPVLNLTYGVDQLPYMVIIAPDGTVRFAGGSSEIARLTKIDMIDRVLKEFKRSVPAG